MRPNTRFLLALLTPILLWMGGCNFDPTAGRTIPQAGKLFTGFAEGDEDVHSAGDVSSDTAPIPDRGVNSVSPEEGLPAGGEIVFIEGWGFSENVKVYFDDEEAPDVFFVNSKKLRVETPAHRLGRSDVSVWWPGGTVRTLPGGFLFYTDLSVASIEPSSGIRRGGTPVTIRGTGFTEDSKLVIGYRLALNIEIIDERTLVAVTPPGTEAGPTNVMVTNIGGTAILRDGFTYTVAPELDFLEPASGRIQGGDIVTLRGMWLTPVREVWFGESQGEILSVSSTALEIVTPPGGAGPVAVAVTGTWGWDSMDPGFFYVDTAAAGGDVKGVVPSSGPEEGGGKATVVACGVTEGNLAGVTFGSKDASVVAVFPDNCAVVVEVPPGTGPVDVTVSTADGVFSRANAYRYVVGMAVDEVRPTSGPSEGGTSITITGSDFPEDVQILVGPLPAGQVEWVSSTELKATTPPGSPGTATVTVVSPDGQALLKNAFLFTVKEPAVYAITPNYGARSGGTFVEVIGAGFHLGTDLYVGPGLASDTDVRNYGLIWAKTPPNPVGTYRVLTATPNGPAQLDNAYTYFDPSADYGGTWGAAIDGSVNVTVMDGTSWKPIEGAVAMLGADPTTPYRGVTDSMGMVTLSGKRLEGPVDLHVTKPAHDASSIVHFNAENATVYLIPRNPSSGEGGTPTEPLPPGTLEGKVVGLAKYVVVPPGECKNKEPHATGLCLSCLDDSDCGGSGRCLTLGKSGKYCTSQCTISQSECPEGYVCAPVGSDGDFCVPALGKRMAHCEVSKTSFYMSPFSTTQGQIIDSTYTYQLDSRLGEVAVVCLGGWEDLDTGEFHPTAMGVKRHINVAPDADLTNQDITLDIPLTRELRLRLDDPPSFDEYGGVYKISVFLDLGSDGMFQLPGEYDGFEPEDVLLKYLPKELSGDIYDAHFLFYGGAYTNDSTLTPYSLVLYRDVGELDASAVATLAGVQFEDLQGAPLQGLNDAASGDGIDWFVGDEGAIFQYKNGAFYRFPSPTTDNINAVAALDGEGRLVAVGDSGVVLTYDGSTWALEGRVTDADLLDVWAEDGLIVAVGAHRIVMRLNGEWKEWKVSQRLRSVYGRAADDIWAVGMRGALLRFNGDSWIPKTGPSNDDFFVVESDGAGGLLLGGRGALYRYKGGWTNLSPPSPTWVVGFGDVQEDTFLVLDRTGRVVRWLGGGNFDEVPSPDSLLGRGFHRTLDGTSMLLGAPAFMLSPFIPFHQFNNPQHLGVMKNFTLDWDFDGEWDDVTLHTISITEKTGKTLWRLTVDGAITHLQLPDFRAVTGTDPLGNVEKRLRIYSAYAPLFDIDNFTLTDLSSSLWHSWSYNMINFQ